MEGLTTGKLWEGWGCPFFTKDVAMEIVNWEPLGINWQFHFVEDAFSSRPKDDPHGGWIHWAGIKINGVTHYPIGAFAWPWHVDSEE